MRRAEWQSPLGILRQGPSSDGFFVSRQEGLINVTHRLFKETHAAILMVYNWGLSATHWLFLKSALLRAVLRWCPL